MKKFSRILTLVMVIFLLLGLFGLTNMFVAGGCLWESGYNYKVISSTPPNVKLKGECAGFNINGVFYSLIGDTYKNPLEVSGFKDLKTFAAGSLTIKGTIPDTDQYVDIKAVYKHGFFNKIILMYGYWWLFFFIILALKIAIRVIRKRQKEKNAASEMFQPKD